MSNIRELIITENGTYELVEGSPTGREFIDVFGETDVDGATFEIQKKVVMRDGTESPVKRINDDQATQIDDFSLEVATGKGNNLYLNVSGKAGTSARIFVKVQPIN